MQTVVKSAPIAQVKPIAVTRAAPIAQVKPVTVARAATYNGGWLTNYAEIKAVVSGLYSNQNPTAIKRQILATKAVSGVLEGARLCRARTDSEIVANLNERSGGSRASYKIDTVTLDGHSYEYGMAVVCGVSTVAIRMANRLAIRIVSSHKLDGTRFVSSVAARVADELDAIKHGDANITALKISESLAQAVRNIGILERLRSRTAEQIKKLEAYHKSVATLECRLSALYAAVKGFEAAALPRILEMKAEKITAKTAERRAAASDTEKIAATVQALSRRERMAAKQLAAQNVPALVTAVLGATA